MYQAILRRIGTEPVKEQSTMIMLLASRNLTRRRVAGVIESAVIGKPPDIGCARVRNAVRKLPSGRHVHYVQDALFVAVFGQSVGEERAILARVIPVEGRCAFGVQDVGVDQDSIWALHTLAYIQDGLVQASVTILVEVAVPGRRWRAQASDSEQLLEPRPDGRPEANSCEIGSSAGILLRCPRLGFGAAAVFEPAVWVENRLAVHDLDDVISPACQSAGRDGGLCGRAHRAA